MVALQMATAAQTSARQEVLPFVMAAIVNVKPRATRILIVPSLSRVRPGRWHIAHHRTNTLVNAWHVRSSLSSVLVCLFGEPLIELGRRVHVYMFCLLIGLDICTVDH